MQIVPEKSDLTGATSGDNSDIFTKRCLRGFLNTASMRPRNDDRVLRGLKTMINGW